MVIKDPRCVTPWFDEYDLLPGGNIESNPVSWARLFFFFVKDIFKKKISDLWSFEKKKWYFFFQQEKDRNKY